MNACLKRGKKKGKKKTKKKTSRHEKDDYSIIGLTKLAAQDAGAVAVSGVQRRKVCPTRAAR